MFGFRATLKVNAREGPIAKGTPRRKKKQFELIRSNVKINPESARFVSVFEGKSNVAVPVMTGKKDEEVYSACTAREDFEFPPSPRSRPFESGRRRYPPRAR